MSAKSFFKSVAAVILTALFFAMAGCDNGFFPDPLYIRVAFIEGVPETGAVGTPLALTGTVRPAFASNVDIIWSVKDAGTTGAVIRGNVLNTNAEGTVVITARIPNGIVAGKDYTQDFRIVFHNGGSDLSGTITITPSSGVSVNTELTATYSGSETVSYQWTKDGSAISGATGTTYTPTEAGSYAVIVSAPGYNSKSAHVDVSDPSLLTLSGTITITPNSNVFTGTELTANYSGSETVTYHWEKDGSSVGTNSNKFTPTEAGSYTVTVSATGYNPKTSTAVDVELLRGTAANPFLVTNEADLRKVGTETAAGGWTKSAHYIQTANINMTGGNFPPIGNDTNKFTGVYDGDGYAITNLSMTISGTYIGLFGANSGTVKNVPLTGTVTNDGTNRTNIGGIAGMNEGTIDNCVFNGTVNGSATTNDNVGGIVGENKSTGTVSNSRNNATVTGRNQVGGVVGQNDGTIINSSNSATVTGNNQVGGIAGTAQGKIEFCYNTGAITGNQQVGGIGGTNVGSGNYIKNSYNTGAVNSTAGTNNNVGGITGYNQSSALIEFCYNTAVISAPTGSNGIGGIAGNSASGTFVRNCVSLSVRLIGNTNIGRIVGNNGGATLSGNVARELMYLGVTGSTTTATGGAGNNPNGLSCSLNVGQKGSVFSGWNYSTIWDIPDANLIEGNELPTLRDNKQNPPPLLPGENPALGTAANPFLVTNEADLRKVGTQTASGGWTLSAHYKQTANITMTGGNFPPIIGDTDRFSGTYDGDGKTITGLTVTGTGSNLGLFGVITANGTVKNVTVTGTITQNGGASALYTGGIAGINFGTIENCSFSGTVSGGANSDDVGGIAGLNSGTIINSRNNATVSGRTRVGGIAGQNSGKIDNCYNTGAVTGSQQVGGIAGGSSDSGNYVKNCYNTGNVTATTTTTTANAGGIVGQSSALIEFCYNTGNVSGTGNIGGIVGYINPGCDVKNNVSLGLKVNGTVAGRIGGTNNGGTTTGNYARQDMKTGPVGSEAIVNTGAAGNMAGANVALGTALTTVFNTNWLSSIWEISTTASLTAGGSLPTLKSPNQQSPAPTLPAESYPLGTAENPFLVTNEADLRKVGTQTASGGWTLSAHYKQTANITMTTGSFPPIGNDTNRFSGSYDGGGFTITGLTVTGTGSYSGFSGYNSGELKNVIVINGTVTQNADSSFTGGIAGRNEGTIENCSFSGTVTASACDMVGGIVGQNNGSGTITNSRSTATVSGRSQVGGITGRNEGTIENSYNTGAVSGKRYIAGIAGVNSNTSGSIKNSYNTGDITATEATQSSMAGGIAGLNQSGALIEYCYNTGNVTASTNLAGGITGSNSSTVRYCVSLGARVTGTNNVGRVAGSNNDTLTDNRARSDMKIGASGAEAVPTANIGANAANGIHVSPTSGAQSAVFSGFEASLWTVPTGNLTIGGSLPTLKSPNQQIPAPTLPAAYIIPGTADNPFLVTNEADLRKVGTGTDGWTLTAYYKQTANITMTGGNFPPIGTNSTNSFTGEYDGDGKTITGLSMTGTANNLGLFGYIGASGTVKNVNASGTITQNGTTNAGGIAGANAGTIDNCSFSGTISGGASSNQFGGIVGYNLDKIKNSRSSATINGKDYVGGIAGVNNGTIENSYNTGAVSGNQSVGGIAGNNTGSGNYIKNSYNTGNITATATVSNVGGIVGSCLTNSVVSYCYNSGNVTGANLVGGISGTGDNSVTVQNCVSLGARVTGTNNIGRIIGTTASVTLANNTARADMKIGASGAEVVPTANTGATATNGASVTVGSAQSSFYLSWDSADWNMGGNMTAGVSLATLKSNTQSPAPTLPAVYFAPGTEGNPFLVSNETELRKVGTETTTGGWTLSAYYKQTANITLTGGNFPWIGTTSNQFTGTYDGDGKTITGLTITGTATSYTGIFGFIGATGTVKNMNVTGTITQGTYTGGIAGVNDGKIDNCSFSGTVNGGTTNDDVGGIAGRNNNNGTIINSRSTATISGKNNVGGIAGSNYGKIDNSYNTGNVSGTSQVGGIAGVNIGSGNYIKNSYNTGNITSDTASGANTGGIVGNNQTLVEYCYNTGNISGRNVVGGIVGNNGTATGTIVQYCVSLGARITGTNNIGRVAGNNVTIGSNKARADMKIGASGAEAAVPSDQTGVNYFNGANVTVGSSTSLSSVFSGFDSAIWNINTSLNFIIGGRLPTLKDNTQSTDPTLPAEYVFGTADNPFLVATEADLRRVGTETAAGGWTLSAHYKQTAGISLTNGGNFTKIGSSTSKFTGSYDGNNFAIGGLTLNITGTSHIGLFAYIGVGGTVKNVTVSGTISLSNGVNATNIGGIAGQNDGTIDKCYSSVRIGGSSCDQMGGIAGQNNGTIINSRFTGSNGATGRYQVGGIAGRNEGGASGVTGGGKIDNCYNTAPINGSNQVGGIVGTNTGSQADIKNCYNTGSITGQVTTSQEIGGIVGNQNSRLVEYCYNTGDVFGSTSVGGIAGSVPNGCTVQNCVSLGLKVTGTSSVGRVAGVNNGTLTNNKAISSMKIGASGAEAIPLTNTGLTAINGFSMGTAQNNVFSGWDTTIWNVNTTGSLSSMSALPTLKDNPQSPAPTLP